MSEDENRVPIIWNVCEKCQTSNPKGKKSCFSCGGDCHERCIGYKDPEEIQASQNPNRVISM